MSRVVASISSFVQLDALCLGQKSKVESPRKLRQDLLAFSTLVGYTIYASREIGLSCFLNITIHKNGPFPCYLSPLYITQPVFCIRRSRQCPVSRTRLLASDSEQLSKMLMKKALAAVGHEQIPFLVSPPRQHLPSTPLDLLQAKAVDQSPQRSSTDRTKTTATVLYRLAMLETYEHPIILWRRVDHRPLHETGLFLPSRMLQKVSVLCPVAPISPRAPYPYPNECGCVSLAPL